jgi:hypothetical protein
MRTYTELTESISDLIAKIECNLEGLDERFQEGKIGSPVCALAELETILKEALEVSDKWTD